MRLINPPVFQTRCRCSKLSWGRIWWIGLVGLALGSFDGRAAAPLRELETDRPDATESPVTVDRGHFQLESSFFSFSRDDSAGVRTETWGVAESNIKYGISDQIDLQLVFTPYVKETVTMGGGKTSVEDFSDLTLRLKYNLWGNDDGSTAFGLMPVVKIPTQTSVSNGRWEGGLIAPFSWRAGDRWGVGAQGQIDRVYDETNGEMDWEFSHTVVVGFDLTDRFGLYLEYLGVAGDRPYDSFFSGGVTFGLSEMVQLDAGTLIGLNQAAEDVTVFSGISWKF
jgi:hypothetical protein